MRFNKWYIVLALFLSGVTGAEDVTVNWTHPTARTNGVALPLSEIKETQLDWGVCAAGNTFPATPVGTRAIAAPATTTTIVGLGYGTWCFRARTADTINLVSANTGTVFKVILAPPNPPVFTTINVVAYEIKLHPVEGVILGRQVGTVPLGTACGYEPVVYTMGGEYHSVPLSKVELTKSPKSDIIVAKCAIG